jgi:hypothetical protein
MPGPLRVLAFVFIYAGSVGLVSAQGIPLATETGNNTSACLNGVPSYCLPNTFAGLSNVDEPTQVQTLLFDPPPGHVSPISLSSTAAPTLMYSGFNGEFLCEYEPWFYPGSSHTAAVNPGYDETNQSVVQFQDQNMINRGCNIVFANFYGTTNPALAKEESVVNNVAADVESRGSTGYPLKLGIFEDVGAFDGTQQGGCNYQVGGVYQLTEAQTMTCIENSLEADMDYIDQNYVESGGNLLPGYWIDGYNGEAQEPVVGFFGDNSYFPQLQLRGNAAGDNDWDVIWSVVQGHVESYAHPFKFIFEFGSFSFPDFVWTAQPGRTAGDYGWPQPAGWDPPNSQFYWCEPDDAPNCGDYLYEFYCAATDTGSPCSDTGASANQFAVGVLYKGFDDTHASWGTNRIMAQQCGQVFVTLTAPYISMFYSSGKQIPYVQIATWNDYEEGTEVETGINGCWQFSQPQTSSANNGTITWTLNDVEPNGFSGLYAINGTIHNFNIWYAVPSDPEQSLFSLTTSVSGSQRSVANLNGLFQSAGASHGTYNIYVELVGMPMIMNEMSPYAQYTY